MTQTLTRIHDPVRGKAYFEDKLAFTTGPVELSHMIKTGDEILVVDVRDEEDYAKGHIPGAINLPRGRWEDPTGLSKERTNILYCYTQTCHLAANAALAFASKGFPVMEMEGGFEGWKKADLDVEREDVNRLKRAADRLIHRKH
ncbi:MAG: rhodanese [Verrucomicrobia bacterium]|nr:MAG: rhodanese [Verrucomicrobiota bacterium]